MFGAQRALGPVGAVLGDGVKHPLRAAHVHLGTWEISPKQRGKVDRTVFILGQDPDMVTVGGEFTQEGHGLPAAAKVQQLRFRSQKSRALEHRQHGSDANAASNKDISLGRGEPEIVAGTADSNAGAFGQLAVNKLGSAAAVAFAKDSHAVRVGVPPVPAKGVLAGSPFGQNEVDVCPRRPVWEPPATRVGQSEGHDSLRH
jgi:hypothetical protein